MDWRKYFRGKRITVMGLGLLGRGVGDIEFLAKQGAKLLVTDPKSEKELRPSLDKLRRFKNIRYVLGGHRPEDFRDCDLVLKAAGVPLDSLYVAEAKKHGIPVDISTALFALFTPATIVGVTGTRGKSTVTHLIYHVLKRTKKRVHLGGNVRGVSTLALLPKTKKGDIAVLELDSWQLQGFGERKISPHVAVFTNFMPDHLNYYKGSMKRYFADKANIFKFQKRGDILIAGREVVRYLPAQAGIVQSGLKPKGKLVVPSAKLPKGVKPRLLGTHNVQNISLAVAALRALDVSEKDIRRGVESFKGVPGRMELLRTVRGVRIYNDTTATIPEATIAALKTLGGKRNVILIMGGADKRSNMSELLKEILKYCKAVFLLPGTGTDKLRFRIKDLRFRNVKSLKSAVVEAVKMAQPNDILLFSPAFASFGLFKNQFDRGEQFTRLVRKLK